MRKIHNQSNKRMYSMEDGADDVFGADTYIDEWDSEDDSGGGFTDTLDSIGNFISDITPFYTGTLQYINGVPVTGPDTSASQPTEEPYDPTFAIIVTIVVIIIVIVILNVFKRKKAAAA